MFGTKIRSWMEAHIVRPRKKQHRKDASSKKRSEIEITKDIEPLQTALAETHISSSLVNGRTTKGVGSSEQVRAQYQRQQNSNNLSSPESAYSTGYSTDGTSPGTSFPAATIAPEYYINIRTGTRYFHSSSSDVPLRLSLPGTGSDAGSCPTQVTSSASATSTTEVTSSGAAATTTTCVASPALTSPRQRNRIRTNPWVSTNNSACNCSPLHVVVARQSILAQTQTTGAGVRPAVLAATASPVRRKWSCSDKKQRCMKCGACARFEAFSSSSSSSLSVNSVHRAVTGVAGARPPAVAPSVLSDEEDDRTLNEMMGKYDESYIYEKETDILSDSDPTDCDEDYDDTDADAGREGGDERDPLTDEDDFDFIDNGSLELNIGEDSSNSFVNMGHCTYHNFIDDASVRRRRAPSDTPTSSRRRRPSERRMRHASSKKRRERQPLSMLPTLPALLPLRARALGGVDGSRSAGATPVSVRRRRAADPALLMRSVGIGIATEQKRRNSISYPRHPPRPNVNNADTKLIELDKEADKKYRELIIEAEHILMAMRTSSPPVSGSPARRPNVGPANKRVELLRNEECGGGGSSGPSNVSSSPATSSPTDVFSPKRKYISNAPVPVPLPVSKLAWPPRPSLQRHCPQSEPVKRKVYAHASPAADAALPVLVAAAAAASANSNAGNPVFHRQKLFHTITSLKKNLESQSETLRHAYYGSSQRL